MSLFPHLTLSLLLLFAQAAEGFVVQPPSSVSAIASCRPSPRSSLAATTENDKAGSSSTEASAFVPLDENVEMDEETLEKVEMFGKGSAKVRTCNDPAGWQMA